MSECPNKVVLECVEKDYGTSRKYTYSLVDIVATN